MKQVSIDEIFMRVIVEEINHTDRRGRLLCYIARVYVEDTLRGRRWLIRTSRVPGSASLMESEFRKLGRSALDRYTRP